MVLLIKKWVANIHHFIDEMENSVLFFTDYQQDWTKLLFLLTIDPSSDLSG